MNETPLCSQPGQRHRRCDRPPNGQCHHNEEKPFSNKWALRSITASYAAAIYACIVVLAATVFVGHASGDDTAAAPTPTNVCTNANDCNGRSLNSEIVFSNGACQCAPCLNNWTGTECQDCPVVYDPFADCGDCNYVDGYVGTWPDCYSDVCNITKECDLANTRAVTGTVTTGCICLCRNQWSGHRCDTCPDGFNSSNACGSCLPGYFGYPACSPLCTNAGNCSGNALDVSGTWASGCVCSCKNNWTTTNCSVCPVGYNPNNDCATCASGYEGYPHCDKSCTAANCNNHSLAVSGTVTTGCHCFCRNKWFGPTCGTCPYGMNTSTDCDRCIDGFSGFPNCSLSCTMEANCSSHASQVTGTSLTGCNCSCRNTWGGHTCDVCPYGYNASLDCGACIKTWQGYPTCKRTCTVEEDCDDHALSVSGVAGQCVCQCRNYWTAASNCSSCALPYAGTDCDACAVGYTGFPNCIKNCTVQVDCSNHATQVQGFANGTCACACRYGWSGPTCATCPVRYNATLDCGFCARAYEGQYPDCLLKCTVQANCTDHAVTVYGNTSSGCFCTCRNQWSGPTCSTCADIYNSAADCGQCASAYELYPHCYLKCTNASNCSAHAVSVSGNIVQGCNCSCMHQWTGGNCATCPSRFDAASGCASCAAGYDTYPHCYLSCTSAANCSNHAFDNATGNTHTGCSCSCYHQWSSPDCSVCPPLFNASKNCSACIDGYGGYPACTAFCNVTEDCSGHAVSVTGLKGACVCRCRNNWTSSDCSTCPARYNASLDCGACADSYETYPSCYLKCTTAANCSDHANYVTGNAFVGCTCNCSDQWKGQTCAACAPQYNQTTCSSCAPGYSNYPTCPRVCTISEDCNSHATNVSGLTPNCQCTCRNSWNGSSCGTCPVQYNATADCGTCAAAYAAFSVYPNCYLTCTVAANCSNHAESVTGNSVVGCNCTCRNQWSGPTCSVCVANYSTAQDCGACAPGYIDYPQCPRACTVALDCNSHASNVSGHEGSCVCNCTNAWFGPACGSCPAPVDATKDCAVCKPAFDDYPACYLTCTVAANCSNHAVNVSGNQNTGCNCSCRNEWFGETCSQCPAEVNASKDCGACIDGYDGYPNCRRVCTIPSDCTGHATAVSGLLPDCNCSCTTQWRNASCGLCPSNFNASANCAACAQGYDSYPACYLTCTTAANCSGHATSVTGNTDSGCACRCRNEWQSNDCSVCHANFNASSDCGACADGYDDYPRCDRICTAVQDCSNHSSNVSGLFPHCNCTCRNQWTGPSCSVCPVRYNASNDCSQCGAGYDGEYPACYLTCTRSANCSGHAVAVSGNSFTGCNCTCRNQWNASTCDSCAPIFDPSQDCGACAEGYGFYPNCTRVCSTVYECNAHARTVSGDYPNCTCDCRNQWLGSTCDTCPAKYNSSVVNDCGTCTSSREGYPICVQVCTNAGNCSNNAQVVSGNYTSGCTCKCRNQWSTKNCSTCAPNFDASLDCGACARGFQGYPTCAPLCTPSDCYNHSIAFSGTRPNCHCTCRNQWSLSNCSVCPVNYAFNATSDCASCAAGYVEYPQCWRTCTVALDCSGNAYNVTGDTNSGCHCACRSAWTGPTCSVCPTKYNTTSGCSTCAVGYASDYPTCTRLCTVAQDCHGNAYNASGLVPNCSCACRNQWTGPACSLCPPKYDMVQDCGACDKYRADDYPNCSATSQSRPTLTLEASISHSLSANETTPSHSLAATSSPNRTTPTATASISRTVTPEVPTVAPTTAAPNTTTASPTVPTTTTVAPTGINTTTVAPETSTASPPTSTMVPASTQTSAPNTTATTTMVPTTTTMAPTTTTMAPTTTTTPVPAADCTVARYCSNHSTSATVNPSTGLCTCACVDQWSGTACDVCPDVYNTTLDCASCAQHRFHYPACDVVQHVVANVSLNCSWDTYRGNDGGAASLALISSDVRTWLLTDAVAAACLAPIVNATRQLVVVAYDVAPAWMMPSSSALVYLDIQLFSPQVLEVSQIAQCLSDYIPGQAVPLTATRQHINPPPTTPSAEPADSICFTGWISGAVPSSASPCGDFLCSPPLAFFAAPASSAFPWVYIAVAVVLVVLAVLAVLLYKGKIGTLAYRKRRAQHYIDSGKYTLEFLQTGDDDVLLYSKRRATVIEAVDGVAPDGARGRSRTARKSMIERIMDAVGPTTRGGGAQPQELSVVSSDTAVGNAHSSVAAPDPLHMEAEDFDIQVAPHATAASNHDFSDI